MYICVYIYGCVWVYVRVCIKYFMIISINSFFKLGSKLYILHILELLYYEVPSPNKKHIELRSA